jgi:exodeoxyribonuclease V alpha subunit
MTIALDASQIAAVELVCAARLGVVTGGPGTGKTTSLRTALDRLDALPDPDGWPCVACNGTGREPAVGSYSPTCMTCDGRRATAVERYMLAAPTGKAAQRMQAATGRDARTVHRLLEYKAGGVFARRPGNPIAAALVVVDEASMLDIELAAALVDAIDPLRTRLVLVGDVNQLPPVGPGRPFADLIESQRVQVARLTTLHRAAAETWVCSQAPTVLAGKLPDLRRRVDFRFVPCTSSLDVANAVLREVTSHAAAAGGEMQVLTPQHKGGAGVEQINRALQAALNPRSLTSAPSWGTREERIFVGDRVLQTRNDYELGVMNGETGVVIDLSDTDLLVDFGEEGMPRECKYSRLQAAALHLAYAITTHKSQGSEWPWVCVVVHSTHTMMLTRALVYTAITRARQGVVIVGDELGLKRAVANVHDTSRNSSLQRRLEAGGGA